MYRPFCSCGCKETHEIARRRTADEKTVIAWSDGDVTWGMGLGIRGIGGGKSAYARGRNVKAAWALMGLVELLDSSEIPRAARAARKAVRNPNPPTRANVFESEILQAL